MDPIERTGMEKWTAPALVIDQSSNNYIHHNYITNTYFSAMTITGTRQLAFASRIENNPSVQSTIREFHYHEIPQSVVDYGIANGGTLAGSEACMIYAYTHSNRIEENAFIDVDQGQDMFLNGKAAYISGIQKGQTNYFSYNYIYDSFDHSVNDYAWYNDMDQDACEEIGNMVNGVLAAGKGAETTPLLLCSAGWAESENPGTGTILLQANVSINCTYLQHTMGTDYTEQGAIKNGTGGSAAYVSNYEQSYAAICPGNIAGMTLPGYSQMQSFLESKIIQFGGTIPNCSTISTDYTLTTQVNPAGGGTLAINPNYISYNHGEIVMLTALPNTGYPFSGWTGDVPPGLESTNPITITMDSDKTITANFTNKIFAPLNFAGNKVENRSLSQSEYINILTWENNPLNSHNNILKFRIYTMEGGLHTLLVELNIDNSYYYHRRVLKDKAYSYAIVAMDINGNEGNRATVVVQ